LAAAATTEKKMITIFYDNYVDNIKLQYIVRGIGLKGEIKYKIVL